MEIDWLSWPSSLKVMETQVLFSEYQKSFWSLEKWEEIMRKGIG